MDDETAEIELISKRMTTILDSFDTRLAKLEKSIFPLYNATQVLNRRRNNIDQTLARIEDLASNQQDLAVDESLILRGPQPGQIGAYKDALERLNTSIAFEAADLDLAAAARLVETGAKKLTQLYTKIVAEGSSGITPAPGSEHNIPLQTGREFRDWVELIICGTLPKFGNSLDFIVHP